MSLVTSCNCIGRVEASPNPESQVSLDSNVRIRPEEEWDLLLPCNLKNKLDQNGAWQPRGRGLALHGECNERNNLPSPCVLSWVQTMWYACMLPASATKFSCHGMFVRGLWNRESFELTAQQNVLKIFFPAMSPKHKVWAHSGYSTESFSRERVHFKVGAR